MKGHLFPFRSGIALLAMLVASSAVSHENHGRKSSPEIIEESKLAVINENYLKTVKPLLKKSCFDCHSSETQYPWYSKIPGAKQLIASDIAEARSHLDFSGDFPFKSHSSPAEDLLAIEKSIADDTMPPLRYRILHSTNALTHEDKSAIKSWVENSLSKLR